MDKKMILNDFITVGLAEYFNPTGNNNNIFEKHIIECLCDIYGASEIKTAYESGNENAFSDLLFKFGLQRKIYDNFLRNTRKYEEFKIQQQQNPALKTQYASFVEEDIIGMALYKFLIISPTLEELCHFENNLLNDFSVIKLHFNISENPNKTREVWDKKKKFLSDDVELVELKPHYLDELTYARFSVKLEDVKKMDYRMVNELNKYIEEKLKEERDAAAASKPATKLTGNTVISTGSGFVDALLIISIIATEASIGFIYLFLHM